MEAFEGPTFVLVDVAGGVKDDGASRSPVSVDPECDLLGHGPADEEGSSRLPEQVGHMRLELRHHSTVAVSIRCDGFGELAHQLSGGTIAVPGQ
jgi:hypothetical protein